MQPSFVKLYHGTTDDKLSSIRKRGLVAGRGFGADKWAEERHWSLAEQTKQTPLSVYVTPEPSYAAQFANYAADVVPGSKPVVIELHVPRDVFERSFVKDEQSEDDSPAFRTEHTIPPAYIVGSYRCSRLDMGALEEIHELTWALEHAGLRHAT